MQVVLGEDGEVQELKVWADRDGTAPRPKGGWVRQQQQQVIAKHGPCSCRSRGLRPCLLCGGAHACMHAGTISWVAGSSGVQAEVRLYNHLFTVEAPGDETWEAELNPASLELKASARGEGGREGHSLAE